MDTPLATGITSGAAVAILAIAGVSAAYLHGRAREVSTLKRWAGENGFQLVSFRPRRFLEPAPFFFFLTVKQPQYFIRTRDAQGRERSAWVRLGTLWEGIYWNGKDKVEVRWDEDEGTA